MKTRILLTGPTSKNNSVLKNNLGFSFLEIMVVLTIMAIMMALVIPSFNKMFASVEGVREGEKVLHLFQKARGEAILKAQPTNITFYTSGLCIFQFKGKIMEYQDLHLSILLEGGKKDKENQSDSDMYTAKSDQSLGDADKDKSKKDEPDKLVQTFNPDGTAKFSRLNFKTQEGTYVIYNFNPVSGKIEMERSQTL